MESNGYIKLHRKMLNNPVVCRDGDYFAVWVYLLLKATHTEIAVDNCGETKTLQPGQMITGCGAIGAHFSINEKKVQRILNRFESDRMIVQMTYPRKGRIITILNWSDYQESDRINDRIVSELCPNDVRIVSDNKNVKNDKNVKNKKENIKRKSEPKTKYAEFVSMTNAEYQALIDSYGEADTNSMIEILDNYKGSSGRTYKSDYRAIKNWVVGELDKRKKNNNTGGNNGTYQQDDYTSIGWA